MKKKLVIQEKNGRYRIAKTDVPYSFFSMAVGKAIQEVVNALGQYQELEEANRIMILPIAIGKKILYKKNNISIPLEVVGISCNGKETEILCRNASGLTVTISEKLLEDVKELDS
ncbi:MAG: hypothetical protein HFF02_08960 [Erysipelotrichaceae bacterium]|nr:hypothetical protein [Erysipelotrichaceae bacterium]